MQLEAEREREEDEGDNVDSSSVVLEPEEDAKGQEGAPGDKEGSEEEDVHEVTESSSSNEDSDDDGEEEDKSHGVELIHQGKC